MERIIFLDFSGSDTQIKGKQNIVSTRKTKSTRSSRTCFQFIIVGFCHRLLVHLENYAIVGKELKTLLIMGNWR